MTTNPDQRPWKPYWTPITQRRSSLKKLGERLTEPHEFHILGAGVTGLAAAIEILELPPFPNGQRHRVVIYEGSHRVGGRINTKRLGQPPEPGKPDTRPYFERGAMRIPTSHDYTWAYAQEAKLQRRRFLNDDRSHDFKKSSKVYRPTDLKSLGADYELLQEDRDKEPGLLFATHVLEPEMALLDSAYGDQDTWAPMVLEGRIEGEALKYIDSKTLGEVLKKRVENRGKLQDFLQDLLFAGLTDRSFLMFVRSWLVNRGDLYELCRKNNGVVEGGMDLLVNAMRARIEAIDKNVIQIERPVAGIRVTGDKWMVGFRDGKSISGGGKSKSHLLCTLPFSILRDSGSFGLVGFSDDKLKAIQGLSYAHAAKVALHVTERFWEDVTPKIKGGRSLNDRLIRATYYPNDGNTPESIGETDETHAPYDLYTQPPQTQTEAEAAALAAEPPKSGPWLMLSSYTFGEHAKKMGCKPPTDTVDDLRRIFPNVDKYVVKGKESESETWYWNQQEWAKGPFVLPVPDNVGKFFQTARLPEGKVFFAGDHLSPEPGWIQGSLFSSLWALQQILQSAVGAGDCGEKIEGFEETVV